MPSKWSRSVAALELVATVAVIAVSVTMTWAIVSGRSTGSVRASNPAKSRPSPPALPLPTEPLSLSGAELRGSPKARIAVVEFSDFQCPFCGLFARTQLPDLTRDYIDAGTVMFAFRHLPLSSIHSYAESSALAAHCAGRQERFWQMHDLLFADQQNLARPSLDERARSLRLDPRTFSRCLDAGSSGIAADKTMAEKLAITGTPTFMVGRLLEDGKVRVTKRVSGAKGSDLKAEFDRLLAERQ